jgi:hypothetical protein
MAPKRQQAPGPPMTLDMTDAEEYRELATQEAALAKLAVTNEKRAQHYAMLLITRLGRREGEVGNYPGNHDRHHAIRNMSPSIPAGCSTMFAESSLRRMHPARWSGDNPVACPC